MTVETPPFRRVLIANRGEIAVRIIRACHEMGMEAVAVYSDADAAAAHVRLADLAVRIGPPPPSESYLRIDAVVEAALASGAEAIHPGYGFLAERASFARAVEAAGLVFVGPASDAIEALGDKLHARRLAARVGVPSVPGTLEPAPVDHPDQVAEIIATARADRLPAAGQGGRRRRWPRHAARHPRGGPRRGARVRFARGGVRVRRRVRLPRARDPAGAPHRGPAPRATRTVTSSRWASGTARSSAATRSSSRRRRRRGSPRTQRRHLHGLAVRLGEAAVAPERRDLRVPPRPGWQLLVPRGQHPAPGGARRHGAGGGRRHRPGAVPDRRGRAAERRGPRGRGAGGDAVEPRDRGPHRRRGSGARVRAHARARRALGDAVRVPASASTPHIEAGERVPSDYDNLIAKLMVHAHDRDAAIDRLRRALDETEIGGVQTTVPFHRAVARSEAFRRAELSTGWVEANWDGERRSPGGRPPGAPRGGPRRAGRRRPAPVPCRPSSQPGRRRESRGTRLPAATAGGAAAADRESIDGRADQPRGSRDRRGRRRVPGHRRSA